jgi:hypothetical protein
VDQHYYRQHNQHNQHNHHHNQQQIKINCTTIINDSRKSNASN